MRGALGGAFLLGLATSAGWSQGQPPRPITLAAGTIGSAFTDVKGVRELEDGRTLVIDWNERELVVFDWSSLESRRIGRSGDGPGEYRHPSLLIALRGDSTLLTDFQTGKWFLLHRDRIVSTLPLDHPLGRELGPNLLGADTMGRVLIAEHRGRQSQTPDSIAVILGNRGNGHVDTVARIRDAPRDRSHFRARVDKTLINYVLTNPLAAADQVLLFPDGWIAILCATPYHVEWRTPNGAVIRGVPLPYTQQRVDERVKRQAIDERWPPSPHIPKFRSTDFPAWPDVVPPFLNKALIALPDGRVAVKRTAIDTSKTVQYDIVDRRGALSGVLQLPPKERLVGFGKRSAYVVAIDADHTEVLRRHPWP